MIDTADLLAFVCKIEGGAVAVDLLKIGQSYHQQHSHAGANKNKFNSNSKLRIALDIEDCLDRFYGGYYSDWACGGQWNRAYQFVQLLGNAFNAAHIEVIAFFDGTLKENKKLKTQRNECRQKTNAVLKHVRMIGTPPPKIWWIPPSGLRTCLRNALRSNKMQVVQTVHDHTMEIIEYYHENNLDGIIGLHPDFIVSNTCRYFSSHDLRLSYKGSLETKEFIVSKILSNLSLTADHLPFIAVFLGGYTLIDDTMLKNIYKIIKVSETDFELRIKKIAEIIRNSPTTDIQEFIKHLNLEEYENIIKQSVEYYQRKGKFSIKTYLNTKRKVTIETKVVEVDTLLASETNENDEMARKILNDVHNLVDDGELSCNVQTPSTSSNQASKEKASSPAPFIYTLPAEVLKTSLNRHHNGIMDPKIYQLFTKKKILLPQILEDEQYRDIPSIHLFYRPARQMIYAILFNLSHQKYLCSKHGNEIQQTLSPGVTVSEWIWSPQNEYKKPDIVQATPVPWAVPTIQRLWFGMNFEDKQRRIKAFLTVMRSDTPLMLNRGYVPQHMLVMACVLRYIVSSERNIITIPELDAFLATAFSPKLVDVDYTQGLVLSTINVRGVYLATLFMQGIETAALANDACGIPLPWMMTNPWVFFDGKLFQVKLKMSGYAQHVRELCDDHIEIVLKIERFRKAILENIEHYMLLPPEPIYRSLLNTQYLHQLTQYNKNIPTLATIPQIANGAAYYSTQHNQQYYNNTANLRGQITMLQQQTSSHNMNRNSLHQQSQRGLNRISSNSNQRGYHLKIGGKEEGQERVVVGSWAGGPQSRVLANQAARVNRNNMQLRYSGSRGNNRNGGINSRMQRVSIGPPHNPSLSRTISKSYGSRINRNKKKILKKDSKNNATQSYQETTVNNEQSTISKEIDENKSDLENKMERLQVGATPRETTVELQNGTTVLASDLANSMCDEILKEDEEVETTVNKQDNQDEKLNNDEVPAKNDCSILNENNISVVDDNKTICDITLSTTPAKEIINNNSPQTGENIKSVTNNDNKKKNIKTTGKSSESENVEERGQGDVSVKG